MTYGSVRKFGSDREKKLWYENCLPSFLAHSGWFLADAVRRCWPPHFLSWASDLSGVAGVRPHRPDLAYAVGGISGGHFNPAVSLGLAIGGRFAWKELVPYWIAQIAGAIVAAAALYAIASGKAGFAAGGFASNGFGELSPGGYSMQAALLIEIVLTAGFLIVILGSTSNAVPAGFAPIAIGLALTLIYLISIPVTNTSVNPARSTGAALFAETAAMGQLWLFWLAPVVGAAIGALVWRLLLRPDGTENA